MTEKCVLPFNCDQNHPLMCRQKRRNYSNQTLENFSLHESKLLGARFVNELVGAAFEVSGERLMKNDRGELKVNRTRQIAMYLMNTGLSYKFTEIASFYHKDRTTVSHACGVIESKRDDWEFDQRLIGLERAIQIMRQISNSN